MCTTICVSTEKSLVAGRTMEFAANLDFVPVFVPPATTYRQDLVGNDLKSTYGFVGTTVRDSGIYSFFDGVNEKGLIGDANYFAGDADYPAAISGNKKYSLRADMFVGFILANCATVDDIREIVKEVELLDIEDAANQPTSLTLHFAFYDQAGNKVVVEPLDKTLKVMDNPVGVMTNSPDFQWHLTNLRNYVHIQAANKNTNQFSDLAVKRLGEGTGLLGLPGDNTPPSRFVRAAHYVSNMPVQKTSEDAVTEAFHILSNFDIPEGASFNPDIKSCDVTHYTVVMDSEKQTYNLVTKENKTIHQIALKELLAKQTEMMTLTYPRSQTIAPLEVLAKA